MPSILQILAAEQSRVAGVWTRKQRRAYHRFLSGLTRGELLNEDMRFFTLTNRNLSEKDLNHAWQIMRKRIEHGFAGQTCRFFDCCRAQAKYHCRVKWGRRKINYCMIRTGEGRGVIHGVFKGVWLPI